MTLSDEARALAAGAQQAERTTAATGLSASAKADEDSSASAAEQAREKLQKRIRELQQEIAKAQSDATMTEDERNKRIQELQTELMSLMGELQKAGGGQEYTGGTVAQGMASSLA